MRSENRLGANADAKTEIPICESVRSLVIDMCEPILWQTATPCCIYQRYTLTIWRSRAREMPLRDAQHVAF